MYLNLEISTTYDLVELDYLEHTLSHLGFSIQFTIIIMQCVRSNSFYMLINGVPKSPIVPSEGLRQENPLSPYIFLLCTKGLVTLLNQVTYDKNLMDI